MRNIKLTIEYDGKGFGGWQKQPSKPNIQGEIENAIKLITRARSRIKWFTAELMHGVHSLRASCKF